MSLDGRFAQAQPFSNLTVFKSLGDEFDDPLVLLAQPLDPSTLGELFALADQDFQMLLFNPDFATVNDFKGFTETFLISLLRDNSADVMA